MKLFIAACLLAVSLAQTDLDTFDLNQRRQLNSYDYYYDFLYDWYNWDGFGSSASYGETGPLGEPLAVSGPCPLFLSNDGLWCTSSSNYPAAHPNNERCVIDVLVDSVVEVRDLDLESCCDKIYLFPNGPKIRIESTNDGPFNVIRGEQIKWQSDHSITESGWLMCFDPIPELISDDFEIVPELGGGCAVDEYQEFVGLDWPCDGMSITTTNDVKWEQGITVDISTIPVNTVNLQMTVHAETDLDIAIYYKGQCVVGFGCTIMNGRLEDGPYTDTIDGMTFTFSGWGDVAGNSGGYYYGSYYYDDSHIIKEEWMAVDEVKGQEGDLVLKVVAYSGIPAGDATITYSYDVISPCPDGGYGCKSCDSYTDCPAGETPCCNGYGVTCKDTCATVVAIAAADPTTCTEVGFNAGYGGCETYDGTHSSGNYEYCDIDISANGDCSATDVCSQCSETPMMMARVPQYYSGTAMCHEDVPYSSSLYDIYPDHEICCSENLDVCDSDSAIFGFCFVDNDATIALHCVDNLFIDGEREECDDCCDKEGMVNVVAQYEDLFPGVIDSCKSDDDTCLCYRVIYDAFLLGLVFDVKCKIEGMGPKDTLQKHAGFCEDAKDPNYYDKDSECADDIWDNKDCRIIKIDGDCWAYYGFCETTCGCSYNFIEAKYQAVGTYSDKTNYMIDNGLCANDIVDSRGLSCLVYQKAGWCQSSDAGTEFGPEWCARHPVSQIDHSKHADCRIKKGRNRMGTFEMFANPADGLDARACCCNQDTRGDAYPHNIGWSELDNPDQICQDLTFEDGKAWHDQDGYSCKVYMYGELCLENGNKGPNFNNMLEGPLTSRAMEDINAKNACCACGGGHQTPPYDHLDGDVMRKLDKFINKDMETKNWRRINQWSGEANDPDMMFEPAQRQLIESIEQVSSGPLTQDNWDRVQELWVDLIDLLPETNFLDN